MRKRLGEVGQGKSVGAVIEKKKFEDLAGMLVNDYRINRRRSLDRAERFLKKLRTFFAESRAVEITTERISDYIHSRQKDGAANASINRELAALKRMFRLGERAGRVARVPYVSMLREDNTRKGFFERYQLDAVLFHLNADLQPFAETAYITGWRRNELLSRQWPHVDFEGGWLRLEPGETKNGEGRNFPLTPELRAVLERQRASTTAVEKATGQIIPWVFHRNGKPIKDYYETWRKATGEAGFPDRILHDFRRTAVRNLERAGVPRSDAMAMVGHRTEFIYRRYAISDEASLKESGAELSDFHKAERKAHRKVSSIANRKKRE